MSYLNQAQDPRRRAGALAGTIAINAAIGIIVVTGLTMSGLAPKKDEYTPTIEFTTPPPPKPTPSPEPQPARDVIPPVPTAPVPPLPLPPVPGPTRDALDPGLSFPDVRPGADPTLTPTPRPAPSFTPMAARPSNNSASWITADDYPRRSLVDGSEGLARYRLIIGTNGQVSSCEITATTGDRQLDQATCRFLTRRARFEAAIDETGAKVVGTYSGSVRWQIPD